MEVVVSWFLINDKILFWGSWSGDLLRVIDFFFVVVKM